MISTSPAAPTVNAPSSGGRRAFLFVQRVGQFASVQILVQFVGFAAGIVIVRRLSQQEYAFFTIASTMQGAINVLSDVGISIGLVSIGGRVWQDGHRFGELIRTGLGLRRKLGVFAMLSITPLLYFMLLKNGASVLYAVVLILIVLGCINIQLSLGVLEVIPRLRSDIRQIQRIDLTGSLTRLALLGTLAVVFLNAGLAAVVGACSLFLQYFLLRHYAGKVIDLGARENGADRKAMLGFIRNQAPNAIFFSLQGQITILLITLFGYRAVAVAEVGALGRLAMIFTVLGALITNIFAPAFARCQDPRRLRWLYAGVTGAVAGFSLLVLSGAAYLPDQFLFVLGDSYSHLQFELLLMVGGAVLNMTTSALWTLNASRAWITGSWLYIPLTLATQLLLIPFVDFSSVAGVLTFNLVSTVPSLLLNIGLSYRGFRQPLAP